MVSRDNLTCVNFFFFFFKRTCVKLVYKNKKSKLLLISGNELSMIIHHSYSNF